MNCIFSLLFLVRYFGWRVIQIQGTFNIFIYAPIPKAWTPDRKSSGLMGHVSLSTQRSWKLSALIATTRCMVPSADSLEVEQVVVRNWPTCKIGNNFYSLEAINIHCATFRAARRFKKFEVQDRVLKKLSLTYFFLLKFLNISRCYLPEGKFTSRG